jgi:hypothetical protein
MKACPNCGQQVANRAKFCPECGAATSVAATASATKAPATVAAEPTGDAVGTAASSGPDRTFVERLLGGDWRSAAYVAVPTAGLAVALSLVATSYLIWIGGNSNDSFGLGHSAGGFFHSAGDLLAMAFGSPVFTRASGSGGGGAYSTGMAPLTISLLVLATFALLLRRYLPPAGTAARTAAAIRAALLVSVALALLSIAGYSSSRIGSGRVHISVSPGRVFGWSLLFFAVVGGLVAARPLQTLRDRASESPLPARLSEQWRLPAEGALVAMTTALLLGGVTGLVIIFAQADGARLAVLKTLPLLLAYLVNLGVDVFQVSMGAALHASIGGGDGGSASVSLFDRHGLSAAYFALLLLPPIAIGAGAAWIRRYRAVVEPRELARACYRMALPAVLIYLIVAMPSRAGFTYDGAGSAGGIGAAPSGHIGVQVLLGVLILAAWFLVVGFAVGRYLLRDQSTGGADAAAAAPPAPRWLGRTLSAGPVAVTALVLALVTAVGGIATADDKDHSGDIGVFGGLFLFGAVASVQSSASFGSGEAQATVTPAPVLRPRSGPTAVDPSAELALNDLSAAEESYRVTNGTFTTDPSVLDTTTPANVVLDIARADDTSFCATAFAVETGQTFIYDSLIGSITENGSC